MGVGTAWPTLPLTLLLLDGLQDTKYVSLQELRQMMEPGSGLLWSPWFRCGGLLGKGCRPFMCTTLTVAVKLAQIRLCQLGYLISPPLPADCLVMSCGEAIDRHTPRPTPTLCRIIAENFLEAWWQDLEQTLGSDKHVDTRSIHKIMT